MGTPFVGLLDTLGIWLDENLSMDHPTKKLCSKLTRALFFLRRAQNFLTDKALISLYYAIFHSHLLYCPIILSGTAAKNIKRIKILQKKQSELYHEKKIWPTQDPCLPISKFCHMTS